MLIGQTHTSTMPRGAHMAILSETPADYDRADNTAFANPLYESGARELVVEEKTREDAGNDDDSFISYDEDEDDKGYTPMTPVSDV